MIYTCDIHEVSRHTPKWAAPINVLFCANHCGNGCGGAIILNLEIALHNVKIYKSDGVIECLVNIIVEVVA